VRHHERGRVLEAIDEQAALVVHRERRGAPQNIVVPLSAPLGRCIQECRGYALIVDTFEEPEEADPIAMGFVVEPVADGGDTPNNPTVAHGDKVFGFGVLEEWILASGEQ
jgi:hypothetical protein